MPELQELLREALLNNSYDYDSMHNILKKTWENSYSYLYALQKNYVEYEEFHYFSNDETARNEKQIGKLYLNKSIYACFDIDYDPIHICDREEYRRSDFYHKNITISDMAANPSIFKKIPIILIDNQVIWDYTMTIFYKDAITFTLPFRRKFVIENERDLETDEVIYVDHKIQVLIVDNIYYQRMTLNRNNINLNPSSKEITIFKNTISNKRIRNLEGVYFCSIHFPNNIGKKYELGTTLISFEETEDRIVAKLTDDIFNKLNTFTQNFYISIVFVNRLKKHTWYNGKSVTKNDGNGTNLMLLQREEMIPYAMPIPVEDFMVWKKGSDEQGYHLEKNIEMLNMYYPNIYDIKDPEMKEGDTYQIFYFYYYAVDLKYTPVHDFFYRFLVLRFKDMSLEEIFDKIYRDEMDYSSFTDETLEEFRQVFHKIIEYKYFNHQYGEIDFLKRYTCISGNEEKVPFEYKEETLKEWIRVQPFVLRDYVIEQNKLYTPIYHLYTNTMDLSKRLRNDTKLEFGELDGTIFDEPKYLFTFHNDREYGSLLDCRVFIDGIFVQRLHQERKGFLDYLYIPASMVTEDSYIEIEVFPTYEFKKELMFTSLDQEEIITLVEPENEIYPTSSDLYFMQPSGETKKLSTAKKDKTTYHNKLYSSNDVGSVSREKGSIVNIVAENKLDATDVMWIATKSGDIYSSKIYDDNFFEITSIYKDGEYKIETVDPKKPVRFTRLKTFKIRPKSVDILNKEMEVHISKIPNGMEVLIQNDGYPYISLVGVEKLFKFNIDYIRIYRNGRLLPKVKYVFHSSFESPRIQFLEWFNRGDIIYIDITPYRYTELYYQEELEEKQTLIDLREIINKPFDIRYYEVYMNCRKLSLNNVFTISPWLITLVNLKSNYNLQIFEKERDWEYFGLDYTENIYYYSIDDLFNSGFITEEERNEIIKQIIDESKEDALNIYPNTNDEEKIDFTDIRDFVYLPSFYYNELIPKNFVNPDRLQFSKKLIQEDYTLISERFFQSPSSMDECRSLAELERRQKCPDTVFLDPDIVIEGKKGKGTQYVYCVGHSTDVEDGILQEQIEIDHNDNIIGGEK